MQSLANGAVKVFDEPQGMVWVKLRIIPSTQYAANGGKPEDVQPVFVTVLKAQIPKGGALEDEIAQLIRVIARVLNLPEANIHILLSSG